jgi:Ulp1 family protease
MEYGPDEDHVNMNFDEFEAVYPTVPYQGYDNLVDCGIFTMMFLEYWASPRTLMTNIFDIEDIHRIRIKIANEMMFQPYNNGVKRIVTSYREEDDDN